MPALLRPNLVRADAIVLDALQRRHGPGATFEHRSADRAVALDELVEDNGNVWSMVPTTSHYGKVTRRLSRLVYELNVYVHIAGVPRPEGLTEKSVYVVDTVHAPMPDVRTGYLAVTVGGPPVLMPLPDLPPALTHGAGTVADTRIAVRAFTIRMADLVNLALPAARTLAKTPTLAEDIAAMGVGDSGSV